MRSLVSDLIPEYNKKLDFFFSTDTGFRFCGEPAPISPSLSPLSLCSLTTGPCVRH